MFLLSLIRSCRKRLTAKASQPRSSARLQLEELENRVVPSTFSTNTYTDAAVQITPGLTVTEKVTATVTPFQGFDFSKGQITPIPAGATAPTSGTVLFNLNNQMQSATLNGSGQATATFKVPLLAFLSSQTLTVSFLGAEDTTTGDFWQGSTLLAPIYKSFTNVFFPSMLTFNQLTPQQVYAEEISSFQNSSSTSPGPTTLSPYYTAQGEKDDFGLFAFNYTDPGDIDTVTVGSATLPGIFAFMLNAYGGLPAPSSSGSGSGSV